MKPDRVKMAENIRDAIQNPAAWPTWRLELLRSDANCLGMYAEERKFREIIAVRVEERRRYVDSFRIPE